MTERIFLSTILGLIGLSIGFLAQRSRICFVAGLRDYILIRDKELLIGLFSFLLTIWFLTSILYSVNLLKSGMPQYGEIKVKSQVDGIRLNINWLKNIKDLKVIGDGISSFSILQLFNKFFIVTIIGGWLIGFVSIFAGGCVLRQHVLFAQGNINAFFYILGFYCAEIIYYTFLFEFFIKLYE